MWRVVTLTMALLLAGILPVVPASAQDESEYVLMGTDTEGDINGIAGDMGVVVVENRWAPLDLVSFEMQEDTEFGFFLRLTVGSLDVDLPPIPDVEETVDQRADEVSRSVEYEFQFTVREVEFQLRTIYYDETQEAFAIMQRLSADRFWETLGEIPVTIDEDLPGFEWQVPSDILADSDGVSPRIGDSFIDMRWESYSTGAAVVTIATYTAAQAFMDYYDYMPNNRGSYLDSTWDVQQGVQSTGHIAAWSDLPVRVSNGEATTFLYEVEVQNTADYLDTVLPGWSGGLDNWAVTFPGGKIRLDPDESRTIPFLVTVPFAHEHGKYHRFDVEFQSQADPLAKGVVELGVRYTAIPQPAGHHPEVYLHGSNSLGYFNTVEGEDYPEDAEDTGSNSGSSCSGGGEYSRVYPLSPALEMGLDFDLEREGEAELILYSEYPTSGYSFGAYFVASEDRPTPCTSGKTPANTVAIVEPSEPVELDAGETTVITTPIRATEFGDFVPYEPGQQLWMIFVRYSPEDSSLTGSPSVGTPEWQPDSSFFLPLNEYHDDVDDFFDQFNGVDLYSVNDQERKVNPGKVTVFRINATNIGLERTDIELSMTGANTDWATLLGDTTIRLSPGETKELAMAVRASPSAVDGELADITLHAVNAKDESVRSLIRLLAEVDTDEEHPDDAGSVALLDEQLQESPSVSVVAVMALLGAVAVARGRRRL